MKWFKRTAQGLSPGNSPKQARPERAAEWRFYRAIVLVCPERSPSRVIVDPIVAMVAISATSWKKHHSSVALSGRVPWRRNPGLKPRLKPWAVLLDHFMVKNWHQLFGNDHNRPIESGSCRTAGEEAHPITAKHLYDRCRKATRINVTAIRKAARIVPLKVPETLETPPRRLR
jgi:hypothetical protein